MIDTDHCDGDVLRSPVNFNMLKFKETDGLNAKISLVDLICKCTFKFLKIRKN